MWPAKPNLHLSDRELICSLDGELRNSQRRSVEIHLQSCAACRDRQNQLSAAAAFYRRQAPAPLPPVERALASLQRELRDRVQTKGIRNSRTGIVGALALASALFLAVSTSPADLSKPKSMLTPGETRAVTLSDVCLRDRGQMRQAGFSIPVSLQQRVFREYGIEDARPNSYEVDYLITPELGGADSLRNLWPQPYSTVWNAHVKDELEDRLHDLVCEGKLDLAIAQRDISTDWIAAYKKYFHTATPLSDR
jgi:hypothetical protein